MVRPHFNRKPTFLWQALLILLPVVVLAALGLFSLRQDKMLAQHEASERAQMIADDMLPKLWADLTATNVSARPEHHGFQVDAAGELVFPPPIVALPTPQPYDVTELTAQQLRLWESAQPAETEELDNDAAAGKYREFIASNPPGNFAAAGSYALGLAQIRQQNYKEAFDTFDSFLEKHPKAVSEAGLPLEPLAEFKLLELSPRPMPKAMLRGPTVIQGLPAQNRILQLATATNVTVATDFLSLDSFCSNAVYHPTPLTPYFLEVAVEKADTIHSSIHTGMSSAMKEELEETRRHWLEVWEEHEQSRQLYSAARLHIRTNAVFDKRSEVDQSLLTSAPAIQRSGTALAPGFFWFARPNKWNRRSTALAGTNRFDTQTQDDDWLAVRRDDSPTGHWFVCLSESEVGARMSALVDNEKQIPEYFGVGIELAGKKLIRSAPDLRVWHYFHYDGKGGEVKKEYLSALATNSDLATNILASAIKSEAGADQLKASIYLTSPTALFQRQNARTLWFGSLVAVSAAAALIGLITAWRAFHKQQQLSEMKSNFVSSVSHELRAPIASVRLLAESLERGKIQEAPKQHEYFRFIGQECRRLSSLIENVLDFSRIEQGRKQYDFEPTDLVALTRQTVKLMETYAAEKQVSLNLDLSHLPPETSTLELSMDGRALQQALVNLVDNAIKHSPNGQLVTVSLELSDPENDSELKSRNTGHVMTTPSCSVTRHPLLVTLSVEDHGAGIPPEEHEKIFERFYRRGSELRRETQGVGIGLSIVKHIVEAHGGKVLVQSAVGQGSRFTIELAVAPQKSETRMAK